jgi:outer membrane receptor protein involved in Fe transport
MGIEQEIKSVQTNRNQTAGLILSAKPSKNEMISLDVKFVMPEYYNIQNIKGKQTNDTLQEIIFNRKNDITFARKTIETKLSYKNIFEKDKNELSIDASFSRTKGNRPAEYYIDNILIQKSISGGYPTNATLQIDYLKSVFNSGKIEYGLKGFSRWNNFDGDFYDLDTISNLMTLNPTYSNDLGHQEYIYSTYFMYSDSLFKTVFYKIGGRLEYNTSELIQKSNNEKINKEYLFPFPYLLLKYNLNRYQNISLSVNRRITRPTYPQLNPYINMIDQMTYETGNKTLEPEILDKIEINYSFIKEKFQFRTNLYVSRIKDFITQISMLDNNNKLLITYINGNRQNKIGGDFDITFTFNKYLSINPSFSLFQTNSYGQYNEINLNTNNFAWTGNIKTIIKPEKQTEIQIFFNYNSPITLPQFNLSKIYYVDIAVKRSFLKNKLSASITLTDVFNTSSWEIKSDNTVYKLYNYSKGLTRVLWFGLTYNFNSYKVTKSQNNKDTENDSGIIKLGQ